MVFIFGKNVYSQGLLQPHMQRYMEIAKLPHMLTTHLYTKIYTCTCIGISNMRTHYIWNFLLFALISSFTLSYAPFPSQPMSTREHPLLLSLHLSKRVGFPSGFCCQLSCCFVQKAHCRHNGFSCV